MGLISLSSGQVFAKDYRIKRRLSEGGMGGVYVAEQISTGATRALKLMHPHLVADAVLRKRFEQEARVGAKIKSDHVVQVLAAGVDADTGVPWLSMELLEGETLASLAKRAGPLPAPYVGEIFVQLCHALGAAHRAGVIHRDLKPDNVFIAVAQRSGVPFTLKVLDFGIAKVVAEAATRSTEPVGTPLWMSPEQTQHDTLIGPPSDVWSLGLIAFYLLAGKHYWRGAAGDTNAMRILREIVYDPLPSANERARELEAPLPEGFDAWFARCVTRDVAARFADAAEAAIGLAPVLGAWSPDLDVPLPIIAASVLPDAPTESVEISPAAAPAQDFTTSTGAPASRTARAPAPPRLAKRHVVVGFAAAVALSALAIVVGRATVGPAPAIPPPPPTDARSAEAPAPTPSVSATPDPPPSAAPSTSADSSPPKVSKTKPKPAHPFSFDEANRALQAMDFHLGHCLGPGDPPFAGIVVVEFASDGRAVEAHVLGDNLHNIITVCVSGMYRGAAVDPFDGHNMKVTHGFVVRPF